MSRSNPTNFQPVGDPAAEVKKLREQGFASFDEWSRSGYQIIKGSKAVHVQGVNYFTKNQVKEKERFGVSAAGDEDWENDQDDDWGQEF